MSNLISQLNLLAPEIFVALMAMLILLLDLFVQDKNKHFIYGLSLNRCFLLFSRNF